MTKEAEREKICKAISSENFEECIKEEGFTIEQPASEKTGKKKANL